MRKTIQRSCEVVFFAFCMFLFACFPAQAQDSSAAWPVDAISPGAPSAGPGSATVPPAAVALDLKAERAESGKYYLDFKAATLINALNVLSNLSGINFVAGREVADRQVNMTLDNVDLEDVLESLANGCNVTYEFLPGRNIYLFRAGSDSVDKPRLFTRVFKLYYVRVNKLREISTDSSSSSSGSSSGSAGGGLVTLQQDDDAGDLEDSAVVKVVENILSERGKVSVDDRSNSLIVTDVEDRLKMVEGAITQLDRPLDQVLINVLLVETFEDLSRDLGVTWGDTNGSFGTITGGISETNFPFETGSSRSSNPFGAGQDFFQNIAQQFNFTKNTGTITEPGIRDFTSFQIQISALESASKLKILAKPKILVLDNHPALIKIATNAAIGTSITDSSGGSTQTQNIERSEIGTILRVTPLINTGGKVTMTVEPTFATVDESAITVTAANAGATGDPTVRTARTTMMVNDAQTIALGGMLFSNQSNGNRKVPFFGNVKQKQWYKEMKDGPEKDMDYDSYFNVRKKLIDTTLDTLDQQTAAVPAKTKP